MKGAFRAVNINYHYFTVKTLAHYAGLNEKAAQYIAHFSQQVDNFIMNSPFITVDEPPDFFLRNGLAHQYGKNKWVFSPCPTGINAMNSVSHNYQLHTLMPFHFIMPKPYHTMPKNTDHSLYRCLPAGDSDSLFINELMAEALRNVKLDDEAWLMEFGMLLHTYADTYAHCYFSGFHGWENESYVSKMEHKQETAPFVFTGFLSRLNDTCIAGIFEKPSGTAAMSPAEITFYRSLPSIGHGNVGHAPDCCDCDISLYTKKDRDSPLTPFIERDNTAFFEDCSKRIYILLCQAAGHTAPDEEAWTELNTKIKRVHSLREPPNQKAMQKNWSAEFPDVRYSYDKSEFMKPRVELLHKDQSLINKLGCKENDLTDIFSEQGDQARAGCLVLVREISGGFYRFNELAYRRVYAATGEYSSTGNTEQLSAYHDLAVHHFA